MAPVVKICCIASVDEARLAVASGAAVPPPTETFLLTSRTQAEAIAAQHREAGTTALQLVDHVPHDDLRRLRALCPGVKLVQVIHVLGEASIDEAVAVAPFVDAILLDSGNPHLAVKELGGTGRRHDWPTSRRIRDAVWPTPLFLAGGLRADNVAEAIHTVQPFGLDLCSSVRSDGQLDGMKLQAFFAAVSAA